MTTAVLPVQDSKSVELTTVQDSKSFEDPSSPNEKDRKPLFESRLTVEPPSLKKRWRTEPNLNLAPPEQPSDPTPRDSSTSKTSKESTPQATLSFFSARLLLRTITRAGDLGTDVWVL